MRLHSSRRTGTFRVVIGAGVVAVIASGCAIVRVSVSSTGTEGTQASSRVLGVTDDGRYSLFLSDAENLVAGDTNGKPDVFRHDTKTGATVRVDVATNGAQVAGGAFDGALSQGGRYAAFATAESLDPADTNQTTDVYVRDLTSNTTTWASQPPPGGFPPGGAGGVAISGGGRYVSFLWHSVTTLPVAPTALYRRDRQAGTTTMLSEAFYIGGMRASRDAHHYVLQPTCLQGGCFPIPDILDVDGSAAGWPALPFANCIFQTVDAISANGRFLVWHSAGGTLAPCLPQGNYLVDRTTATASPVAISGGLIGVSRDASALLFTADGSFLPGGTAGRTDLYLRDLVHSTDTRVSISTTGKEADADVTGALLSDDGHQIAFTTTAGNLVPDDHNGVADVFERPGLAPPTP
jgi:hypothetical protein